MTTMTTIEENLHLFVEITKRLQNTIARHMKEVMHEGVALARHVLSGVGAATLHKHIRMC